MFFKKCIIRHGSFGILLHRGRVQRALNPGLHTFWGSHYEVEVIREGPLVVGIGPMELTTKDGGSLRVQFSLIVMVVDPILYFRSGSDLYSSNSVFGVRGGAEALLAGEGRGWLMERIADREFSGLLDQATETRDALVEAMAPAAARYGLEISCCFADQWTASGALRGAAMDLLKAELEGRAALQRARNEAATLRSLLNTARLLRDNPGLLELRALSSGQRMRLSFNVHSQPGTVGAGGTSEESES